MKKLMRKKVRRGLKEGDPGYLERASDTDSALEDSSEGSDSSDQDGSANSRDSEADDRSNDNDGGELELVKTLKALLADEGNYFTHKPFLFNPNPFLLEDIFKLFYFQKFIHLSFTLLIITDVYVSL